MIILLTTRSHSYTHDEVGQAVPGFRVMSYPAFHARPRLPRATYIFSDFDRLDHWGLDCAAQACRRLREAGCRVLNDPARALQRVDLLRRLRRMGVNSFNAWRAAEADAVDHFPVFLRLASAHRGVLTDLLEDRAALEAALERLVEAGRPLHDLAVIEYRAAPLRGTGAEAVFRKRAAYRVGEEVFAAPSVHERAWTAKYGERGVAGEEGYAEDLEIVRASPHREVLRRAFDAAGIDYGRADFAEVDGRAEIYEINTNPAMNIPTGGPALAPARAEAAAISWARYVAALEALDDAGRGPSVALPAPQPIKNRLARRLRLPAYTWTP